jgi:hypothetical protein
VASIGEQLRTTPSEVRERTTGDIQEANGYKNALDVQSQVRLNYFDDLGMVGGGGGGRGGLELGLSERDEAGESRRRPTIGLHQDYIRKFHLSHSQLVPLNLNSTSLATRAHRCCSESHDIASVTNPDFSAPSTRLVGLDSSSFTGDK